MPQTHKVRWAVTLSDNSSHIEGEGLFEAIANQPSPYSKLRQYMLNENLSIVSLHLFTDSGETWMLPSADLSKMPEFSPFRTLGQASDYAVKRFIGANFNGYPKKVEREDIFTVGIAIYGKYKLSVWVNENNTKESFVLVEEHGK